MTSRGRSFVNCPAAVFVVTLLAVAAPVRAQNVHGAIAFGETAYGQSVAYGYAWNYPTGNEARQAALSACLGAGGTNCAELAWFQNGCGALAVDQYGNAQGRSARTQDQAEARAVRACEAAGGSGCAVVGSQCTSPGRQAGTWSGSENVLSAPERGNARGRQQPAFRTPGVNVPQGTARAGENKTDPLSGTWTGQYSYRRPTDGAKPVPFRMNLVLSQSRIIGTIVEPNTFGDSYTKALFAQVEGELRGNRVRWIKRYDGTGGVSHGVTYTGILDRSSGTISGQWKIGKTTGNFQMKLVR